MSVCPRLVRIAAVLAGVGIALPLSAQAPEFEVSTIKPSTFMEGVRLQLDPSGLFSTRATSLAALITFAYDLHARQILGGPGWLDQEKYDIRAKPDQPGKPSLKQLKAMLRELLADRFQLAFHRDIRNLSVYALAVAKSGPKLARDDSDPNGVFSGIGIGLGRLGFTNIAMAEFASMLQGGSIMDRPVVDQTGLGSSRYDLALKWTPDAPPSQPGAPPDNTDTPPDLFTALQQQLGLKLESVKATVEVLIIDRAEKPSAN